MFDTKPLPNIVFLDMDGVLVTPRACIAVGNTGVGYTYLDPIACSLVKRLCEQCNAKIVISSAWRQMYDRYAMESILAAACPNLDRFFWQCNTHWRTGNMAYEEGITETSDRGREIKQWIDNHETKFNNFVVLDDMADMRPVQDNLVRCDYYEGFGFHTYMAAQKILKQECVEFA
jgi:hypothetical protein